MAVEFSTASPEVPLAGAPSGNLPFGAARALGVPSHPITDLRRLAARLGAKATTATNFSDMQGLPGPQLLHELGERFGISIAIITRNIEELTAKDCPCVVLLNDGTSRLLVDAQANGPFIIAGDGDATTRVDRARLSAAASGGIFQARRIEPELRAAKAPMPTILPSLQQAKSEAMSTHPFFRYLFKVSLEKRRLVFALAMAGFLSGLINLSVPIFTMVVFDRVIPHSAFETLWALIIGVVLLLGVDLMLRHVRHALGDAISVSAATGLGARFFSRLLNAPLGSLPRTAGTLVQPFQEMNGAATIAPQFIAGIMVDLPFFLLVVLFLGSLGGWIAIIPVIGAAMLFLLHSIGHWLAIRDMGDEARLSQKQTQMIIDTVAAGETIRVTGSGPSLLMRWEERSDAAAFAGHKLKSHQNLANHAGAVVMQMVTVTTVAAGAYAVSASLMTVGALSACMMLASRAIMPVATVMGQGFRLKQMMVTTASIARFTELEPEHAGDASDGAQLRSVRGAYRLTNVSFAHSGSQLKVIADLSFSLAAGERVAIIGKSGSGKSTLLRLMARLYDASNGSIHIDDRDIRQMDPLTLRRAVALMSQEPYLFDATLEANMTAGLGTVDPDWFAHVAQITGVADFANRNPAGFSLETGAGGCKLSGGERQSAALARSLMGKPKLLLLDEPTSAMDNEREARIVQSLTSQIKGGELAQMGLVIATHRLPILALVDRIIWMDGGKIVADGPKDEIFRKFGLAA
jgi:ATP-binding cassette, subfamily C, bacterial LapB